MLFFYCPSLLARVTSFKFLLNSFLKKGLDAVRIIMCAFFYCPSLLARVISVGNHIHFSITKLLSLLLSILSLPLCLYFTIAYISRFVEIKGFGCLFTISLTSHLLITSLLVFFSVLQIKIAPQTGTKSFYT